MEKEFIIYRATKSPVVSILDWDGWRDLVPGDGCPSVEEVGLSAACFRSLAEANDYILSREDLDADLLCRVSEIHLFLVDFRDFIEAVDRLYSYALPQGAEHRY